MIARRATTSTTKGIRELEDAFSEIQADQTEIRDFGERVVAIGHLRDAAAIAAQ
jgi:hypothetical protein